jgi:glycerol-3-phosphate dehydrogenase
MAAAVSATTLTARRREQELAGLVAGDVVDVLVIGGGVTGAGVALDAASRGLSVALIERTDLAAGTSRWSSKLAHGGLRYIAGGHLGVAWESAVERNRLATVIAPHLIRPMAFLMPSYPSYPRGGRIGARALLAVADGLRTASRTPDWMPRTSWIDGAETARRVPAIGKVKGSYVHVDGALEDDARLVVGLARTAAGLGARVITHCSALEVGREGARIRDDLTGDVSDVRARSVVVAAGVWSGGLVERVPLRPSKGAHLVVRGEALGNPTAAFNVLLPGSLSRFVFGCPRPDGTVLVGLTDDAVDTIEDEPTVSAADEKFLLEMLSTGLTRPLSADDVLGRYAGLRPMLGGDGETTSADISRRHALLDRDGVLVIVGGKLTTYRRMAQDAVDRVVQGLGRGGPCRTSDIPLVGAGSGQRSGNSRLDRRFGTEARAVAAAGPVEPIAPDVPVLKCEVQWAVEHEGAVTAADVLDRRIRVDMVPAWRSAATPYVEDVLSHVNT